MKDARGSQRRIAILAVTAVALATMVPVALAGASQNGHSSPASSTSKQLKSLRKQVAALTTKLAALEAKTTAPAGPAGGSLSGSYPNPGLAPNSVTTAQIANDSVTSAKIANGSIGVDDLGANSVTSAKIANGSIGVDDLGANSVNTAQIFPGAVTSAGISAGAIGPVQIGDRVKVESANAVPIAPGFTAKAIATCPPGSILLSGGALWVRDAQGNDPIGGILNYSAPGAPNTWEVRAQNNTAVDQQLIPRAVCLMP